MHPVRILLLITAACIFASPSPTSAQGKPLPMAYDTPEAVVRDLYSLVTFAAGQPPDWGKVRNTFLPQAVIILRTSRDSTTVFDVDGFVRDFEGFIQNSPAKQQGFEEEIVNLKSLVLGEIARVTVVYQAHIPGIERPPQKGVDMFLLNKRLGRWWIASIVNEIPTPSRPIPEELLDGLD